MEIVKFVLIYFVGFIIAFLMIWFDEFYNFQGKPSLFHAILGGLFSWITVIMILWGIAGKE